MVLYLRNLNQLWGEPIGFDDSQLAAPLGPVITDSRKIQEGSFFIPLVGKRLDGHLFLEEVRRRGAQAAVVSRTNKFPIPDDLPHWLVEDSLQAYQDLCLLYRRQLDIPIIAVTGSTGKTTTRELIKSVLAPLGQVLSSAQNNNNDVGVPLTLLSSKRHHRAVVVEMGMRGIGQIKRLSCCSNPDIAVITNVGSAHIGLLGGHAQIANAKCEITQGLRPDGVLIIPSGFPLLEQAVANTWTGRVLRVAIKGYCPNTIFLGDFDKSHSLPSADLTGSVDLSKGLLKVGDLCCKLPLEGVHNALNLMLAIAVAGELSVPIDNIQNFELDLPTGRSRRLICDQFTILDETYNSSPEAVQASLELLVGQPGRHFAVLGSMLELGEHSIRLHKKVAEYVVSLGLDGLVIVGEDPEIEIMESIAKSLPRFAHVALPEEALEPLVDWLLPGDSILLKASRAVALERLVPILESVHL